MARVIVRILESVELNATCVTMPNLSSGQEARNGVAICERETLANMNYLVDEKLDERQNSLSCTRIATKKSGGVIAVRGREKGGLQVQVMLFRLYEIFDYNTILSNFTREASKPSRKNETKSTV